MNNLNQILMCYEKYIYKHLGHHYPVEEQHVLNRTETADAIRTNLITQLEAKKRLIPADWVYEPGRTAILGEYNAFNAGIDTAIEVLRGGI